MAVNESVQPGGVCTFELIAEWDRSVLRSFRDKFTGRGSRRRGLGLTVSTTSPFRIAKKVGIAWTLYLAAMLGHLSTSKRTNETQSTAWASLSNTGAIALQGPHQVCTFAGSCVSGSLGRNLQLRRQARVEEVSELNKEKES